MVMVDTDILAGIMKGDRALMDLFVKACRESRGRIYVTPIQTAEIFLATRDEEIFLVKNFLDSLCVIPISSAVSLLAASYQKEHGKTSPVQLNESFIAAAALSHSLKLWTLAPERYPMVSAKNFWKG